MSKSNKIFFFFPLTLALTFSSILCCCLLISAEAEILNQPMNQGLPAASGVNHCDSHKTNADHSGKKHQCECPKLQGILAKDFDIFTAADVVLYFYNHQIIQGRIFSAFVVPNCYKMLSGQSPPQFSLSPIPLYIKNPTLRI